MFSRLSKAPSHLWGLSLLFLPAYSSLHCLYEVENTISLFPFFRQEDFWQALTIFLKWFIIYLVSLLTKNAAHERSLFL